LDTKSIYRTSNRYQSVLGLESPSKPEMLYTVPHTMASQNSRVAQASQAKKLENLEKVLQHISSWITNGT